MKRLLLITLLVLSSGPAYGEWMWATGNDPSGITVYADPDTIRRNGDVVKMWALMDFMTIQTVAGNSYLSSKFQKQFDCAEERIRGLAFTNFSGNMATGDVVLTDSDEETKWVSVQPGSINQVLWTVACNKK